MTDYQPNTTKENKGYGLAVPIDTSQNSLSKIKFNLKALRTGNSVKILVPRPKYTKPSLESKVLLRG